MRKSLLTFRRDLQKASACRVNEPVVVDGNLISSHTPLDLAPFARATVDFLAKA